MANKKKNLSKMILNAVLDTSLLAGFALVYEPENTGLALHEWMGLGFGALIFWHLLLHWKWIVQTTTRLLRKTGKQTRLNYVLNSLLFIDITAIVFTGVMISRVALRGFNSQSIPGGFWLFLHEAAAAGAIALIGAHLAMHWKWIWHTGKRLLLKPVTQLIDAVPQPNLINPIQLQKEK